MRIEQLEYLTAVIRHGSLRRAGEHLHVSQSALSEAISGLERELGVPLLERHRSGARVSREGRDLLPLMAEILAGVAQLKAAAQDQPGHPGRHGQRREFSAGHPGTSWRPSRAADRTTGRSGSASGCTRSPGTPPRRPDPRRGAYWFGEGVLPVLAERGLWKDERPRRHHRGTVPFATAGQARP